MTNEQAQREEQERRWAYVEGTVREWERQRFIAAAPCFVCGAAPANHYEPCVIGELVKGAYLRSVYGRAGGSCL